jgi:hypothetical protein
MALGANARHRFALALILCAIAVFYPAWRASKIHPAEALLRENTMSEDTMKIVMECRQLVKNYQQGEQTLRVLDHIDLGACNAVSVWLLSVHPVREIHAAEFVGWPG